MENEENRSFATTSPKLVKNWICKKHLEIIFFTTIVRGRGKILLRWGDLLFSCTDLFVHILGMNCPYCVQLLQRHISWIYIEAILCFQSFSNSKVSFERAFYDIRTMFKDHFVFSVLFLQALQRAGASLRVLVSPGWLYRGPSITQVFSFIAKIDHHHP